MTIKAKPKDVKRFGSVFSDLLRFNSLILTTNADTHFHNLYREENIAYRLADFSLPPDPTKLYHVHGCIKDPNSLVFTLPEYIKRYSERHGIRAFLEEVFNRYTVLFIGYGMNELDLLEFLILRSDHRSTTRTPEAKHFLLWPYYRTEESILACHRLYYQDMDIQVLPYAKDDAGYNQLIKVVEQWAAEIRSVTFSEVGELDFIDRAIDGN
jgi:hypothetical protein